MVEAEEVKVEQAIDINELSWWDRLRMSKFGHFVDENSDGILIFLGGLCTLGGAFVGRHKANTSVFAVTEDTNEVVEIRAKKVKKIGKVKKHKKS